MLSHDKNPAIPGSKSVAEREGFEPSIGKPYTAFRERPVQPLLHLSVWSDDSIPNCDNLHQMLAHQWLAVHTKQCYDRYMADSIFTKIINGDIPARIIYRDDEVIAFLDINPLSNGHVLVVPRQQIDSLWELPTESYHHLWTVAQRIALHMKTVLQPERVGVIVEGFDVPHAHIHLVPLYDRSVLQLHHGYPVDTSDATLDSLAAQLKESFSTERLTLDEAHRS